MSFALFAPQLAFSSAIAVAKEDCVKKGNNAGIA